MRLLSALVLVLALTPIARAQGLVQLVLSGEIDAKGGARIEVEITAQPDSHSEPRTLTLGMQLAEHTSAADLATLLQRRLEAAKVRSTFTSEGQSLRPISCLFIEDVLGVALRLGRGLHGSVTLCDQAPLSIQFFPPDDAKADATFALTASTFHPILHTHEHLWFDVALETRFGTTGAADALSTHAIANGWSGDVVTHEVWHPGSLLSGSVVDGCTLDLVSKGDWRLQVVLAQHGASR